LNRSPEGSALWQFFARFLFAQKALPSSPADKGIPYPGDLIRKLFLIGNLPLEELPKTVYN